MIKMDDLNHHKNLYAGRGIEWMVEASFIAAAAETGDRHGLLFKNCHKFEFNKSVEPGEIISYCSTLVRCGRTEVDLERIATEIEARLSALEEARAGRGRLKVAVMGCAVNGPGEAREADIGVACGRGEGLIFRRGEIIKKVKESEIVEETARMVMEYENL